MGYENGTSLDLMLPAQKGKAAIFISFDVITLETPGPTRHPFGHPCSFTAATNDHVLEAQVFNGENPSHNASNFGDLGNLGAPVGDKKEC